MVETRPYGTWDSPLQVDEIYKASSTLAELYVDDTTQEIYHVESRASEGGRSVLCKSLSPSKDLIGPSSNVRTRVHEYGGSAATLRHGWAYYSDFVDGRVFRVKVGEDVGSVKAVTPESSVYRYADFAVHPQNPDLVLAIREDHTIDEPSKVVNALVVINAANKEVTVVVEGNDFYASPRWNNDGTKAAWIEWSHPDMPWEGATLYYASFKLEDEPKLTRSVEVAGKHNTVSVTQPLWGLGESKDKLFFASDETGYQNIWVVDTAQEGAEARLAMKQLDKDFTTPMWSLGTCDYALLDGKTGLVAPLNDRPTLSHFDLRSGKIVPIAGGEVYGKIDQLKRLSDTQAVFIGSKSDAPATLVIVTLGSSAGQADFSEVQTTKPEHLKKPVDPAYASRPETYTLRVPWNENAKRPEGMSEDTKEVDLHVILFPPTNPKFKAPEGTRPPCLVGVHGGPTSQAFPVHNTFYQYFTSRGFAVLDVNYGGSSGYGRQYMQRLSSNWGIVDVHDTVHAVSKLAEMGKIDGEKVGIRGGSAGGFTTLACLTDSRVFSVGISLYGVSDIKLLVADTHKFESQYMFKLVGGTPEQVPQVYHDRSPLYKAANIRAATLILQGNDDKIVPPSQAHEIIKRIEEGGHGQVESVFYDGEGHGFRKLENLKDSLIRTEAFLKKTFGLSEE